MFLCSQFVIPILSILKKGIKKITYYMLETPDMYGEWVKNSHHNLENQVDRIIYIEKNRYVRDSQDFNLKKIPATLYYNSYPVSEKPLSILERNKRSLNYGTLTSRHTYLSWYQEPQIQKFPIDLIGQISEPFTPSDQIRKFDRVPHDLISAVVRNYSYVITVWNEHERRSRFAPSNKFFEAVSLGVPVISAPHPQHVEVIRELGCGIVMNDWKLESFEQALEEAQKLIAGDKYAELVEGCFRFAHSRYGPKANSQKLIEFLEATS
jgi:hypothetical protein